MEDKTNQWGAKAVDKMIERTETRDHLFISYAWEDGALAEWLALKLTAEGYRVWCDRFQLLGGERWPNDIDFAIKHRTFRVLHLLSHHSLNKENPSKERQLALTLSKERNEGFLIPLNLDRIKPSDLPWQLTDINFIPFHNWADGLKQLLKKLDSCQAPRPTGIEGRRIAAETFLPSDALLPRSEPMYSNCFAFHQIPAELKEFQFDRQLTNSEEKEIQTHWVFYKVGDRYFSFQSVPIYLPRDIRIADASEVLWRDQGLVGNLQTEYLVSSLLKRTLDHRCIKKGLTFRNEDRLWYFPTGLLEKERIFYVGYKGRRTRLSVIGERQSASGKIRHHIALKFWIRKDILADFVVIPRLHLYFEGPMGQALEPHIAQVRRKNITKRWWNHEWLSRQMAIMSFFAGEDGVIVIGEVPEEQVRLSATPLYGEAPIAVNEAYLRPLQTALKTAEVAAHPDLDEEEVSEDS